MDEHWHLKAAVLTMLLAMLSIVSGCGRTEFYELSGSISSVNYPYGYSNDIECTYSITNPGLHQYLFIRFTDLDTEAGHDVVEIWCPTSDSNKRTFSGRNISVSFQLQSCNSVYVYFLTDESAVGRGFNLVFNWLISVDCGRTEFSELGGFVSSPNYPFNYIDNANCTYSIRSPGLHQSVFIGFTDFDTEAKHDTVEIWCSTNVASFLSLSGQIGSHSSFTLQPCKDVKVRFRTDLSVQRRGFNVSFNWTLQTTIYSPTTEPTSIQTETDGLHDAPFAILAALGAKTLSSLVVVLASLLGVGVFIIILLSIIYAIRRVKRRNNATKTRLDVRSAVNPRGCSNDGYSLEPISTCQRPVSVKSDLEEPDYELMDSQNHNDEDVYENVECILR